MRLRPLREVRAGAGPAALQVQGVRLPLHSDASPGQASGDEGAGRSAVRRVRRVPGHDREAPGGFRRSGLPLDPPGRRGHDRSGGSGGHGNRANRRNVALRQWKKNKVWAWKAHDPLSGRNIAWEIGSRSDSTLKRLLKRIGLKGRSFLTDGWEGFRRCIPEEQLFTGKDLTFNIEQDNSNTRHYLARFRRRSKVTSRSREMAGLSLRLLEHLSDPRNYVHWQQSFSSIFK